MPAWKAGDWSGVANCHTGVAHSRTDGNAGAPHVAALRGGECDVSEECGTGEENI